MTHSKLLILKDELRHRGQCSCVTIVLVNSSSSFRAWLG